ncbi:sulfate permease [Flammeovirga yaeyamensis]|uniref:Sulfate permease n=1 Tax=Flammeovirga yaeyamensis TaxID=367791 RepID=A0AAX1MZZ4_9BACT|nr:sulfate permease [Flammeovirga yaeyamensis]MBB3700255.1 SulP family sulfate permease [Flammeovirga yaeyamensis]NMF37119.1 sulfate permease [Flammeovirga yaeyamensis]QWG00810.1 sulfate permease [Flammeovirga yaeyamensis]
MGNPITAFGLLKNYRKKNWSGDISAGFATGVLLIPQGMAYAVIAGLPVEYGLYAALMAPIAYFLFGTTNKLVIGPAALDSMLLASGVASLGLALTTEQYVTHVLVIVFFAGLLQILAGIFKFGFIANFFSQPLLKGFTSAAAILIAFSQFGGLIGLKIEEKSFFHQEVIQYVNQLHEVHWPTLFLGFGTLGIIVLSKKFKLNKLTTPLMVSIGILLSIHFGFEEMGIKVIGDIPKGLPHFSVPDFTSVNLIQVMPISLVVAIIGFTVSNSIIKSVEEDNKSLNINREFTALGLANTLGVFFGGYQASSSFSRSAINKEAGAKTRMSNLVSCLMIAVVLLFFTPVFYYLPKAILAAIIIAATPSLFSFTYFKELYSLRKREFFVGIFTFLMTLEFGVIIGLISGVTVSMFVFLYQTLKPHVAILGKIGDTRVYRNILRFEDAKEQDQIVIIRIDAPLYFSNIRFVIDEMQQALDERSNIKSLVIKSESINSIDITALNELKYFIEDLNKKGIHIYFCSVVGPVRDLLYKVDIVSKLGGEQLFLYLNDVVDYIQNNKEFSERKVSIANQADLVKSEEGIVKSDI